MSDQNRIPRVVDVLHARARLAPHIVPTQVRYSSHLSKMTGRDVWLVLECLQRTGSFKFRGALNRLLRLRDQPCPPNRIMTVSSGNHAIGTTIAGQIAGISTTVCVAESVSPAKLEELRAIGAHVVVDGANFDEAEARMQNHAELESVDIVSSYDSDVIAGHATIAWDVLSSLPDLAAFYAPVASGGLIAGCSIVVRTLVPNCSVYGVQTRNAPAMKTSLEAGRLVQINEVPTIADGLAGNVLGSELPFSIIQNHVSDIFGVCEESLLNAIKLLHDRERIIVEPAGAATVAALLESQMPQTGGPIAVVLSGSNIHHELLSYAIAPRLT